MSDNISLKFDEVIRSLYSVALSPAQWPAVLDSIASLSGSTGAVLFVKNEHGWSCPVHSQSVSAAIKAYVEEGWAMRNPWLAGRMKAGFQLGDVYSDLDIATPTEQAMNPFYSEFLHRFQLGQQMVGMLHSELGSLTCLVVHRDMSLGPFQSSEKKTHLLVTRHFEQLLRISSAIVSTNAELRTALDAFDAIDRPAFILDEAQRTLKRNSAADKLMGDYFDQSDDRLKPMRQTEEKLFRQMVEGAHDVSSRPGNMPALTTISHKHGKERLVTWSVPLMGQTADELGFSSTQKNVLVLAHPLQQHRVIDPAVIRAVYGLSMGEAKLCSVLASGRDVKTAATELGIMEGSARVVLNRIFAKLGVHRQSELIVRIRDLMH